MNRTALRVSNSLVTVAVSVVPSRRGVTHDTLSFDVRYPGVVALVGVNYTGVLELVPFVIISKNLSNGFTGGLLFLKPLMFL